eukprot:NODE_224_length_13912_cov_0.116604.p5 type:complete len:281 gc:universal NODE_224_length_13912_cov_0.116604:4604-3762(-)
MIFALSQLVMSSKGDNEGLFQFCVSRCMEQEKQTILLWNKREVCDYECMWSIVHQKQSKNEPIEQYYGKWPFYRIWMIQEPMSTLFSFLNLIVHLRYFNIFNNKWKYGRDLNIFIILNLITWLASMSLHTISNNLTERLDYFSAGFVVIYGIYIILIYLFKLNRIILPVFILIYSFYVNFQLNRTGLDYGLHMLVFSIIGAVHSLVWFINGFIVRKPHAIKIGLASIFTLICLGALEWMDFALIGYLDAHALWHLSTVFVAKYWYSYWLFEEKVALSKIK